MDLLDKKVEQAASPPTPREAAESMRSSQGGGNSSFCTLNYHGIAITVVFIYCFLFKNFRYVLINLKQLAKIEVKSTV